MPFGLGFFATAGAGAGGGAFELISTQVLASDTASITFSSIPATYKHLQLRFVARSTRNDANDTALLRFNSDTGSNYNWHLLYGQGSLVTTNWGTNSTSINLNQIVASGGSNTNIYTGGVVDILDYASTAKNTTVRALFGESYSGQFQEQIKLGSGAWRNTAAVDSLTFRYDTGSVASKTRLSLYGIKG